MLEAHRQVNATFELATSGWVLGPLGDRALLDSKLDPSFTLSSIDMNVGNTPVDPSYALIEHHQKYVIPWFVAPPRRPFCAPRMLPTLLLQILRVSLKGRLAC